ncbi:MULTISPECIES: formate/nitrite transporter family protein [Bacillaceae]|uniref:formate/nitrite transporter family protein n=1 Tax=Bacillaceae TaxID=186817 RepID=UPI001E2A23BB|nr:MULTISPECIES: formate/nitrite transporter family protein [Bacillaceae]MCE4050096.1 formate/nitrite transporter family protein [Bacillus sp. Au-Bac7]MCM3031534.1 formate/nitrite transporter family protein [Niallia sp. MER 6]MDL0435539.1 formate/nitrite transporter family protein [Niallia sp. SS-2023]UPO88144.1 formate/nitrite transporter family protein [Niallia sp. Man26]
MKDVITAFSNTALMKTNALNANKSKYIVGSMLAGFFVGLGIILIFTIGGMLAPAEFAGTKIIMGVSFGIALSLVIMAGADLFTGNNMVMTIGMLENKVTWKDTGKVWGFSYIGNFIGSILVALLFSYSGLAIGGVADFVTSGAAAKMNAPFMELLIRGILCNILVCLAVWCSVKLKDETAKLIMIFWCLFAFITSGFEHSIANMTLLSIALIIPHPETVSFGGMFANLLPVTLGNIIGGAVFVGAAYWYNISEKTQAVVKSFKKEA